MRHLAALQIHRATHLEPRELASSRLHSAKWKMLWETNFCPFMGCTKRWKVEGKYCASGKKDASLFPSCTGRSRIQAVHRLTHSNAEGTESSLSLKGSACRQHAGVRAVLLCITAVPGQLALVQDDPMMGKQFQCNLKGMLFTKIPYVFLQNTLEKD